MKKHVNPMLLSALLAPLLTACVGTTGSGLVDFDAYASGPTGVEGLSGAPGAAHSFRFLSPYTGYTITLTTATLQIGAVYLDASPCNGSSGVLPCVNEAAATVAQVNGDLTSGTSGILLDALSPDAQPFPTPGSGIVQQALSAEVWLATGSLGSTDSIDDLTDAPQVAQVAGRAEKDGKTYRFTGSVTIGQNRLVPVSNPALPGEYPICDQRIVRPICLPNNPPVEPEQGVTLHVQVDPRGWFNNVDFSKLEPPSGHDQPLEPLYQIPDTGNDVVGQDFFQGLESSAGVYSFTFEPP
jgi:hypothetical protein